MVFYTKYKKFQNKSKKKSTNFPNGLMSPYSDYMEIINVFIFVQSIN